MMRAAVREHVAYESIARPRLPERLARPWTPLLLTVDALAALAAAYVAGMPPAMGPAACAIACGALALAGVYRWSYAVRPHDEAYHVLAGSALAAPLFWIVFALVGRLPGYQSLIAWALATSAIAALHALLASVRRQGTVMDARCALVTPQAQWRVGHSWQRTAKRAADAVLGGLALILLSPVMLTAAAAIAFESGTPVLFRQTRVGRGGTTFPIYKFRTMVRDAGPNWVRAGDARITRVGAFLRRTSIDELPQLVNVLRGEMSLIGPRPEMLDFAAQFQQRIAHYNERHLVAPGITGWAQIQYKRNLDPSDAPEVSGYDLFYVENASPVLDAIVLVKTAVEFLFHRGT